MASRNKIDPFYTNLLSPDNSYVHREKALAAPEAKMIEDDDDNTVKTRNRWRSTRQSSDGGTQHKIAYVSNTGNNRKEHTGHRTKQHAGISDSGTTGNFCNPGADVENIKQA